MVDAFENNRGSLLSGVNAITIKATEERNSSLGIWISHCLNKSGLLQE